MDETDKITSELKNVYKSLPGEEKCRDIFYPLIFSKWASDVFEEEAKAIYTETKDKNKACNIPQLHKIFVSKTARWSNLVKIKYDLGPSLMRAFEELEENNEFLKGVFLSIRDQILNISRDKKLENDYFRVIQNLSLIPMGKAHLENAQFPSVFDKILAYIMKECYFDEFYTPGHISKLLASILNPRDNMTVFDPFCGTGALLLEFERYAKEHSNGHLSLFAQEINTQMSMYCKLSFFLNECNDAFLVNGDSISEPGFIEEGTLKQFDRVVSVPPFGKQKWGYEIAEYDQYSRFRYGIPPKNSGDFGYVQHIIACLKEKGKGAIVSPEGILFRSGPEAQIRKNIIQSDLIEAIIMLPPRMFSHTGIPTIITVISMDKPTERRNSIIFISAEHEYEELKRQNILSDNNIAKIVDAYKNYRGIEKFCRVVTLKEIESNDYSLNFSLYLDTKSKIETVDIVKTLEKIQNLKNEREELVEEIAKIITKLKHTN